MRSGEGWDRMMREGGKRKGRRRSLNEEGWEREGGWGMGKGKGKGRRGRDTHKEHTLEFDDDNFLPSKSLPSYIRTPTP